jgi:hypothetical protein
MRCRAGLFVALFAAVLAVLPASATASRTSTPVRLAQPSAGDATVAGFQLKLLRGGRTASLARAFAAARVPKGVTVLAVLGKQTRSDRVKGVLVVLNRARAVAAHAAAATVTVNLKHAAIPRGYRTKLAVTQRRNVLRRGRAFRCSAYFHASDLRGALRLAGQGVRGLAVRDAIADACLAAGSSAPFAGEGSFRAALNAPSGTLAFTRDAQVVGQLDGSATFNYPVSAFTVLAPAGHAFTACGFAAGSCQLQTKAQANDYAVLRLTTPPAPPNAPLPFAVQVSPPVTAALPFEFFGFDRAGARFGPLLSTGP